MPDQAVIVMVSTLAGSSSTAVPTCSSRATTSTTTATSAGGLSVPETARSIHDRGQRVGLHLHLPVVDSGRGDARHDRPHNTFAGGGGLHFQTENGFLASGNHIYDNVFTDPTNGITDSSGANWGTQDHNLNSGLSGPGDITGTPVWTGGSKPTSYGGYHLAPGSPGRAQPPTAPTSAYADAQEVCETEILERRPVVPRAFAHLLSTPPVTSGQREGDQKSHRDAHRGRARRKPLSRADSLCVR